LFVDLSENHLINDLIFENVINNIGLNVGASSSYWIGEVD
jgi:hypothetical protein